MALKLPVVSSNQLDEFPFNVKVSARIAQLIAVRAREEAIKNIDNRDYSTAQQILQLAQDAVSSAPMTDEMKTHELAELEALEQQLKSGEHEKMRKQASYQNYRKRNSRPE